MHASTYLFLTPVVSAAFPYITSALSGWSNVVCHEFSFSLLLLFVDYCQTALCGSSYCSRYHVSSSLFNHVAVFYTGGSHYIVILYYNIGGDNVNIKVL